VVRIIIADDHPMVRAGLRQMLSDCHDMDVVAEADGAYQALKLAATVPADVLIFDITMPGPGYLESLRRLRMRQPELAILIYSMHANDVYALRALRAGAAGYVTKCQPESDILTALRLVRQGRRYVSPMVAEHLLASLDGHDERPDHETLSEREYQVLCLLGQGHPVTRVAEALSLSPKTVSTYRIRVLKKLGLNTTAGIVRYAVENGLVT
jgi:DNA-binding NarL/FixJ family response regulator